MHNYVPLFSHSGLLKSTAVDYKVALDSLLSHTDLWLSCFCAESSVFILSVLFVLSSLLHVCLSVHSSGEVDQTNCRGNHWGPAAHRGRCSHRGDVRLYLFTHIFHLNRPLPPFLYYFSLIYFFWLCFFSLFFPSALILSSLSLFPFLCLSHCPFIILTSLPSLYALAFYCLTSLSSSPQSHVHGDARRSEDEQ